MGRTARRERDDGLHSIGYVFLQPDRVSVHGPTWQRRLAGSLEGKLKPGNLGPRRKSTLRLGCRVHGAGALVFTSAAWCEHVSSASRRTHQRTPGLITQPRLHVFSKLILTTMMPTSTLIHGPVYRRAHAWTHAWTHAVGRAVYRRAHHRAVPHDAMAT